MLFGGHSGVFLLSVETIAGVYWLWVFYADIIVPLSLPHELPTKALSALFLRSILYLVSMGIKLKKRVKCDA